MHKIQYQQKREIFGTYADNLIGFASDGAGNNIGKDNGMIAH